jgi:hypothetical protein
MFRKLVPFEEREMVRVLAIVLRMFGILVFCIIVGLFTLPRFSWMILILAFVFFGAVMHYMNLLPIHGRLIDLGNISKEIHRIGQLIEVMQDRTDCEWAVQACRWQWNELSMSTTAGILKGLKNKPTLGKFPPYRFPDPPLSPVRFKATLRRAKEQSFQPGTLVVAEGDSGSGFYFLLRGRAEIVQEGGKVAELKCGAFFSESSFLDGIPVPVRIVACDKTICLSFSPWELVCVLDHYRPSETLIQTPS